MWFWGLIAAVIGIRGEFNFRPKSFSGVTEILRLHECRVTWAAYGTTGLGRRNHCVLCLSHTTFYSSGFRRNSSLWLLLVVSMINNINNRRRGVQAICRGSHSRLALLLDRFWGWKKDASLVKRLIAKKSGRIVWCGSAAIDPPRRDATRRADEKLHAFCSQVL